MEITIQPKRDNRETLTPRQEGATDPFMTTPGDAAIEAPQPRRRSTKKVPIYVDEPVAQAIRLRADLVGTTAGSIVKSAVQGPRPYAVGDELAPGELLERLKWHVNVPKVAVCERQPGAVLDEAWCVGALELTAIGWTLVNLVTTHNSTLQRRLDEGCSLRFSMLHPQSTFVIDSELCSGLIDQINTSLDALHSLAVPSGVDLEVRFHPGIVKEFGIIRGRHEDREDVVLDLSIPGTESRLRLMTSSDTEEAWTSRLSDAIDEYWGQSVSDESLFPRPAPSP